MKRSKIFLGITTCLLAVAGIAVAKSNRHAQIAASFKDSHRSNACTPFQNVTATITHLSGANTVATASGSKLYSAGNACTNKLYTVALP